MDRATLRCYGDLAELADADRDGVLRIPMDAPRSVLAVVQSVGIPHTEVDLVLVDGRSVGWEATIRPGQRVAIYPAFVHLPAGTVSRVRPDPPHPARFAVDAPLGPLATMLHGHGADVWHATATTDDQLARAAGEDGRVLLTRHRAPLMHDAVRHGVLLRSHAPEEQLLEVARRHALPRPATVVTPRRTPGGRRPSRSDPSP